MDLSSRLESLLDRPDIDQMNEEFETRQSKWLLDMAVSEDIFDLLSVVLKQLSGTFESMYDIIFFIV